MSGCPNSDVLKKLLSGQSSVSEQRILDAHLTDCKACRRRLDQLTEFDSHRSSNDNSSHNRSRSAVEDEHRRHVEDVIRRAKQQHIQSELDTASVTDTETHQPDSSAPFTLGSTDHKYQVLESVGRGATGTVYRAIDEQLNRVVALKVLHPNLANNPAARQRLQQEARALANLSHPNVVALYEIQIPSDSPPFLVMEFIEGKSVQDHIQNTGSFDARSAAKIVASIASALHQAHEQSLIHRDVKSSNILLSQGQPARITDFGLARQIDHESQLTQEGMIAGTPAYMSPEQIADPTSVDARSDVYSLGIVLYELLTATVPFLGTTRMTLRQVENDDPRPPRELNDLIPKDLEVICLKAIQKQPADRYHSAADFQSDLERFIAGKPIAAKPAGRMERIIKWYRRNPRIGFLWSSIAVLFLLATAIAWVSAYRVSTANRLLTSSEERSRTNAKAAAGQRDIALETIRKLIIDVHEAVEDLPADTTDVEQLVSRIAMDGLRKMQEAGDFDPTQDIHAARGSYQLGATLFQVGEFKEAEQFLQRALDVGTRSLKANPVDELCNTTVIETHWMLSSIDQETEEFDKALEHTLAAKQVCQMWKKNAPAEMRPRAIEGQAGLYVAESLYDAGQPEKAHKELEAADQLLADVENEFPDSDVFYIREDLFGLQDEITGKDPTPASRKALDELLADAQRFRDQNNADNEEFSLIDALDMMDELDPRGDAAEYRTVRINSAMRLAQLSMEVDYPNVAREYYNEVLAQYSDEPADADVEDWYAAQVGIADAYGQQGRIKRSAREYRNVADRIIDRIGDSEPSELQQRFLRECLVGLAELDVSDSPVVIKAPDNPALNKWLQTESHQIVAEQTDDAGL